MSEKIGEGQLAAQTRLSARSGLNIEPSFSDIWN